MDSIDLLEMWTVVEEKKVEFIVEHQSKPVKVHCNDQGQGYQLTAVHLIDGTIDRIDTENPEEDLADFIDSLNI